MTFRSGSVRGSGIVYSRRRGRAGRGAISSNQTVARPSVIYEEPEEESDSVFPRLTANPQVTKQGESLKSAGIISFF